MVGFVPTMGALHDGHLSLIRRAKADCDVVVVVGLRQPDAVRSRRGFRRLSPASGAGSAVASEAKTDALFAPSVEEMYPSGFQTVVDVPTIGSLLEGAHRPGHFAGVATVVTKLLNMVQPNRAYFGQEGLSATPADRARRARLNQTADIVMVPTCANRMAWRCPRATSISLPNSAPAAPILSRVLKLAEERIHAGALDSEALGAELSALLATEPLAKPDYISLVDAETLQPVVSLNEGPVLVALAVRFGTTRLIDNVLVAPPGVTLPRTRGVKS